jgi:hypothetical protein
LRSYSLVARIRSTIPSRLIEAVRRRGAGLESSRAREGELILATTAEDLDRFAEIFGDAYIRGIPAFNDGTATINEAGAVTPWGVFDTIPPLS